MMLMRFAALRSGAFVGPLDAYTTNLWSAVSLKRLLSSYTGGAFDATNTTSSATGTIGFNADGTLDTAALASLAGSNDVVIDSLTNQAGGSGRSFTATTTQRPKIVSAGSYLGTVQFNGTSNGMGTGNTGTPSAFTLFLRGKLRSLSSAQIYFEHSVNFDNNESAVAFYSSSNSRTEVSTHKVSPSLYSYSFFSGDYPNNNVHCYRYDRSQTNGALQTVNFVNGTKQTRSGNGDTSPVPSGNFAAQPWYLGARNRSSLFAALDVHTALIYEGALSDADVASISSIIAAL